MSSLILLIQKGQFFRSANPGMGLCYPLMLRQVFLGALMLKNYRVLAVLATAVFLFSPVNPSAAASSPTFSQAVSAYLSEDYSKALTLFQALAKRNPTDSKVHYYLAICHVRLKDKDKGATEYQWILKNSKDEALKEIVTARLLRIKPELKDTLKVKDVKLAEKHGPVRKVILFSTAWCPTCKEFEPTWEKTKAKLGSKIQFVHLNAEDAAAWKEVALYTPRAYPTIVYLDAKGNVIENKPDAPSAGQFLSILKKYGSTVK